MEKCEAIGAYPAPTCLKGATNSYYCVWWGLPGELHGQSMAGGQQDYRVFQLRVPLALALTREIVLASRQTAQQIYGETRYVPPSFRHDEGRIYFNQPAAEPQLVHECDRRYSRECGADFL